MDEPSTSVDSSATSYHPEDVRAAIRKRHGTLGNFARRRDIKPQALADWLRGRTSAPVASIVAAELGLPDITIALSSSMDMDDSENGGASHRINDGRR